MDDLKGLVSIFPLLADRRADSLIAPLVYSQLISATVLGIVVFGDWPDLVSLAGLVLIAISGLGSLLVHQRAGRARLSTPPCPRTP